MRPIPRPNLRRDLPRLIVLTLVFWLGTAFGRGEVLPFVFVPDAADVKVAPVMPEPAASAKWAAAACAQNAEAYIEAWGENLPGTPEYVREFFATHLAQGVVCHGSSYLGGAPVGILGEQYAIYLLDWENPTAPPPTRWFMWYVVSLENGRIVKID